MGGGVPDGVGGVGKSTGLEVANEPVSNVPPAYVTVAVMSLLS